ncbi:hypothetical protein D2M30_2010 [Bacillus amyloliquefaciens]|nr:hypothetical protein D2M30_2010 [Bacillus amyloliquefaciens]
MIYFHVRRKKKIKSFIEQKVFTTCLLNNKMEENQKRSPTYGGTR